MSGTSSEAFHTALRQAKRPLALAGAGLSAASGIPTFRGAGGLWRQHDALSLATPQAFRADPSKVWQFYHYRRSVCLKAQPNPAHFALTKLLGEHSTFMPASESFHLITQNVDGLSARALPESSKVANNILEMHGNLFKTICTKCSHSEMNYQDPIAAALMGSEDMTRTYKDIPVSDLLRCKESGCEGLLRPGVVWFGESIPNLGKLDRLVSQCDLILVIGTSSTVYPAAGFADQVQSHGGKVAVFNIDPQPQDDEADFYFQGPVEETLPALLGIH